MSGWGRTCLGFVNGLYLYVPSQQHKTPKESRGFMLNAFA
jgi:hypothetical protein